ncbi:MAG TPA: YdeI/OmpD-associated family protein [Ramlibacter sp.]
MPRAPQSQSQSEPCRFATQRAFESWLRKNHASSDGIWLLIAKPGAGEPTVTYSQAVEAALCFGWIDGQKKALDGQHWLQRFTPRRANSVWSKTNRAKAEALVQSGRMQPSGLAQIERAKANGRWETAYDGARTAVVPPDLQAALDAQPEARTFFDGLNAANRYAVLWRVQTAKRPETRARRIDTLVAMLARGEKIHG